MCFWVCGASQGASTFCWRLVQTVPIMTINKEAIAHCSGVSEAVLNEILGTRQEKVGNKKERKAVGKTATWCLNSPRHLGLPLQMAIPLHINRIVIFQCVSFFQRNRVTYLSDNNVGVVAFFSAKSYCWYDFYSMSRMTSVIVTCIKTRFQVFLFLNLHVNLDSSCIPPIFQVIVRVKI